MQELYLIKSEDFGEVQCDFYQGGDNFYMTREQIGQALGYTNPRIAIAKIHERYKDKLNKCSGVVSLGTPGGLQETIIYNRKGVFEICHWSR